MSDLSIGAKPRRVMQFIIGLADPLVRARLAAYNFDNAELAIGLDRVNTVIAGRLGAISNLDPKLLAAIDAWENKWYPVVEVVLRTNYPAVHAIVFRNLKQSQGLDVVVTTRTMLDRLDLVSKPVAEGGHPEGAAARAHVVKRGFTTEVVQDCRGLLAQIGMAPEMNDPLPQLDAEAMAKAEKEMWNWYLEWSGIARSAISNRRALRSLGFLRRVRRADGREEDVVVDDDDLEDIDDAGGDDILVGRDDAGTEDDIDVTGDDLVNGPTPTPAPAPEPTR